MTINTNFVGAISLEQNNLGKGSAGYVALAGNNRQFANELYDEYHRVAKCDYHSNPILTTLTKRAGYLMDVNAFGCILINQILEKQHTRTLHLNELSKLIYAPQTNISPDLDQVENQIRLINQILEKQHIRTLHPDKLSKLIYASHNNTSPLLDQVETWIRGPADAGIILRGPEEKKHKNYVLAQHLIEQLEHHRSKVKKFPVIINLDDLTLENNSESPHYLTFKLKENANPIYAPILNQKKDPNPFRGSYRFDERTGIVL